MIKYEELKKMPQEHKRKTKLLKKLKRYDKRIERKVIKNYTEGMRGCVFELRHITFFYPELEDDIEAYFKELGYRCDATYWRCTRTLDIHFYFYADWLND